MPNAQSASKNIQATERMVKQTGGRGMKMARPNTAKVKPVSGSRKPVGNSKRGGR